MEIAGIETETLEFEKIGSWPPILRRLILVGVALLTLLLGYYFDLSSEWDALDGARAETERLKKTFEETQNQVLNLEAYKKQVQEVQKELNQLTEQLPKRNEEASLLEEISQQANTTGLQFRSIKPKSESFKGFYVEQPMELILNGDYHGFGEFASNLARMPRILTLHDFSIKAVPEKEKGPLEMVVTAKTYWSEGL